MASDDPLWVALTVALRIADERGNSLIAAMLTDCIAQLALQVRRDRDLH